MLAAFVYQGRALCLLRTLSPSAKIHCKARPFQKPLTNYKNTKGKDFNIRLSHLEGNLLA